MHAWDEEADIDGEVIALQALIALLEVEGDDALAWEQRDALSDVAVEALALQERRKAREERKAARRREERAQREEEAKAIREIERQGEAQRVARARDEALALKERDRRERLRQKQATEQHPVEPSRVQNPLPTSTRARPVQPAHRPTAPLHYRQDLPAERPLATVEAASTPLVSLTDMEPPNPPTAPILAASAIERPHLTGADLTRWRIRLGLTQQAAAVRLGVRQGTISKAESRPNVILGPALHRALARASNA